MLVSNTMVIYLCILTLEKVGIAVNYQGIFITLAKNTTYEEHVVFVSNQIYYWLFKMYSTSLLHKYN
jgi:hypothetical protein